jgi:predicted RecB family nuclease
MTPAAKTTSIEFANGGIMQKRGDQFFYSPSDLITFMESRFASFMERWKLINPSIGELIDEEDVMLKTLQQKGYAHEDDFLDELREKKKSVVAVKRADPDTMLEKTRIAMADGAEVIAQAYLTLENFGGLADFLIKIPGESKLGNYHYEIWDAKLSKKIKPYFAVQLCCYAEMLMLEQGIRPENVAVVLGDNKIKHLKVREYFAYYTELKKSFIEFQNGFDPKYPPDPANSTSHGRWSTYSQKLLQDRDHPSLVANITRTQIKRLNKAGIQTVSDLATTDKVSIPKLSKNILSRLKSQAAVQLASRGRERPIYEILQHENGVAKGLALLPPRTDQDIFFDIEGFPFVDGGLEYLWGATYFDEKGNRTFRDFWAHNQDQEKQAFIEFIKWVFMLWQQNPKMHVYHYASYEKSALRKLMGRYGACEFEVDTLLRNQVFVDLYNVVRHGLLIGEPRYSIKNVEHIYRGKRDTDVASGGDSIIVYEEWLNNPDGEDWKTSDILNSIRDYNIDDCNSTQELASWLREEQTLHSIEYIGPETNSDVELSEDVTEATQLRDKLLVRAEAEDNEEMQLAFRNLAWMLEFHNRENKPTWWRLFDRLGLNELDLYDDMDCLVGLQRTGTAPYLPTSRSRNKVYEYAFDINQPFKGHSKGFYVLGEEAEKITCHEYRSDDGIIGLQSKNELPPRLSIIPDEFVSPHPIPDAIKQVIEKLLENGFSECAISDFLLRRRPRFIGGTRDKILGDNLDNTEFLKAVISAATSLDNSYLCIQGPPGSGKTYTAKHIIGDLLSKGQRIGISSNSHKAITNLMEGVAEYIETNNISANLIKVGGDKAEPIFNSPSVTFSSNAKACFENANQPSVCIGGTAWLFCNTLFGSNEDDPQLSFEPFDYLFIDEAGQVSIANLIGMSRSCKNIILMGDQMQLGQPIQGSHPDDSGQSILEYLLQDHATIPADLGVFLPKTFRMHPNICSLISDQVYDQRLLSDETTQKHMVETTGPIVASKAGISFMPVSHEGNTQGSDEEVEMIKNIAEELLGCSYWPERKGEPNRRITWNEILFVAPYNFQVNLLKAALGPKARVGSVDKFQGQEAPIVIMSMCTSVASESPRGIDFLFSKNRLNVALSRAQSLAIVVGSPELAATAVSSLHQMELVNFFAEISQFKN